MKLSFLRRGRELAMQVLYERDISNADLPALLKSVEKSPVPSEDARAVAAGLVRGAVSRIEEIDRLLSEVAENWSLGRMSFVDRNCLRIACYELLAKKEIPFRIVLDEAIEVAKRYGSEESGLFVNGILDAVARRVRPEEFPGDKAMGRIPQGDDP